MKTKMIQRICIDRNCIYFNWAVDKGCIKKKVFIDKEGNCLSKEKKVNKL